MDKFYFELVCSKVRTCNRENKEVKPVPERHFDAVLAMLKADGRDADGNKIA